MHRRAFLVTAAASGLVATTPGIAAGAPLDATAIRQSPKDVKISWTPKGAGSAIFVSTDPDAPHDYMRALRTSLAGSQAVLPAPVSPRPYFLLRSADGRETRVAERLLPLKGGRNFRDVGGYRAEDGRQVRWGRIYRSGVMSGLTAEDMIYLARLGIAVICDLRSVEERQAAPSPFLNADAPLVVATDYNMATMMSMQNAANRAEAIAAFAQGYVGMLDSLRPQYTDLFARLVRHETPLAFNCSAGKDRTGVATALVLSVLGVPRAAVVADYALTQVYTPPSLYLKQMANGTPIPGLSKAQAERFAHMPPDALAVMMGSDPEVMERALATIDSKFGGPLALAKSQFGLTDSKIAGLRDAYLI